MCITVKARALSCWIFENTPNENCSLLTEKRPKAEGKMSPKILLERRTRKGKIERERRKKGGEERKKKQWLHY